MAEPFDAYTDPIIADIHEATDGDGTYQLLLMHVSTGFLTHKQDASPSVQNYWKISDNLSIEDG